ncbi:unnamed protein product [Peniophora sp. CBMAI 1063]|nr:unnamed protein product [Peniophora sp. CBMAI 1063]
MHPCSQELVTQSQLLREVDALSALICNIRRRANDLVPVATLPIEVFLAISTLVAEAERPWPPRGEAIPGSEEDDEDADDHSDRRKPATLGWIRLTHVSSRWRRRLLAYPVIWGRDVGLLPAALSVMLERAGSSAPISVTFRDKSVDRPHLAMSTTIESGRLRSICWEAEELPLVAGMLSGKTLPILETLRIQPIYTCDRYGTFQSAMSKLHAPRLRRLEYFGFFVPFVAPALTYIEIHHMHETDLVTELGSISFSTFMGILSAAPLLEELWLTGFEGGWSSPVPYNPSDDAQPLELRHLRFLELEIRGPTWQLNCALKHLAVPYNAYFSLFNDKIERDEDFELLSTVSKGFCHGASPEEFRIEWDILSVGAVRGQQRGQDVGGASLGCFALDGLARRLPSLGIDKLLEGITTFTLLPQSEDPSATHWLPLFHCFPNVTTFVLGYSHPREDFRRGRYDPPSNEPRIGYQRVLEALAASARVAFPQLHHLRFARDVRPAWVPLSTIHSCLERRSTTNAPLLQILDLPSYLDPSASSDRSSNLHRARLDFSALAKRIIWRQPEDVDVALSEARLRVFKPAGTPICINF